eukprot:scaffold8962_cov51-Phaeocystis_antarctica.AAC.4
MGQVNVALLRAGDTKPNPSPSPSPSPNQVNVALLGAVRQLLASGQPTRGLLSSLDPDDQLPWTLDYLTMVAGVADALCRLRDRRDPPPPLLPTAAPLAHRRPPS